MRKILIVITCLLLAVSVLPAQAQTAAAKKPNILVIFGDDIGWFNISAYCVREPPVAGALRWAQAVSENGGSVHRRPSRWREGR